MSPAVNFFRPFIDGAINILKASCRIDVTLGRPYVRKAQPIATGPHIAGVITVKSTTFNGRISLIFSEETFLAVMEGMLGEPCKEINEELESGATELINMIYGHAKVILNQQGHDIREALPSIARTPSFLPLEAGVESIILPFTSLGGDIYIEILNAAQTGANPVPRAS